MLLRYFVSISILAAYAHAATTADSLVFQEKNGIVAGEAEHYSSQSKTAVRQWYTFSSDENPNIQPDGDPNHSSTASQNAYLEILPDTRRTHDDPLQSGANFSDGPGVLGLVHYWVNFENTGRYYVWVRAYSTGTEDNGIHVGIDDTWPSTGRKMQWCDGKNTWRWESKQRTDANHCGEPYKIYLDVKTPGVHKISFSMREDGFEFDKWLLTQERSYRPTGTGPDEWLIFGADSTAPAPPQNLKAELIGDNTIRLNWSAAVDKESRVISHRVYRNDELMVTLKNGETSFEDEHLAYESEYTYQVSAENYWKLESKKASAPTIMTTADRTPPELLAVIPNIAGNLLLTFSEPLDEQTSQNPTNFRISPSVNIAAATLYDDRGSIILHTSEHMSGKSYTITIQNVEDRNGIKINDNTSSSYIFTTSLWYDDTAAELINGARSIRRNGAIRNNATYLRNAESAAIFTVMIPQTQEWYLWGRFLYQGSGNDPNSFYVSVDGEKRKSVGNNQDYFEVWHWDGNGSRQTGPGVPLALGTLEQGEHTLVFTAREPIGSPGSATVFLDGILLTPDADYRPSDATVLSRVKNQNVKAAPDFNLMCDAYPNPFNSVVTLYLQNLNKTGSVKIYNPMGQLMHQWQDVQTTELQWDASGHPSSTYFIRVESGDQVAMQKIVLMK